MGAVPKIKLVLAPFFFKWELTPEIWPNILDTPCPNMTTIVLCPQLIRRS